jgi:hypothetical protein
MLRAFLLVYGFFQFRLQTRSFIAESRADIWRHIAAFFSSSNPSKSEPTPERVPCKTLFLNNTA